MLFRILTGSYKLLGNNGADGTNCSACSAINTFIGIDDVNVTGRNCVYGTFINADSTCCASFSNSVCHDNLNINSKYFRKYMN